MYRFKYFFLALSILGTVTLCCEGSLAKTTDFSQGDTIIWSISGVSDAKILCGPVIQDAPTVERLMCTAPLKSGSTVSVEVEMQNPPWVGESGDWPTSEKREFAVGIPYKGMRYLAKKTYFYNSGEDNPNIRHAAAFSPYQASPAYPDLRHQADKWIQIQVAHFEYGLGMIFRHIWVIPSSAVGYTNSEQNGLPVFARTQPDVITEKPDGCNGCSAVGLPGYSVNMSTLRPVFKDTVFAWESRGPDVNLSLTWNSELPGGTTNFGSGWRFSYDAWLTESSDGVTVERDDGGSSYFAIPTTANQNVESVTTTDKDTTVVLEYAGDPLVPAYVDNWDGWYEADGNGYRLQKVLDGDPSLVTFILTPPGTKESHIFQRPVALSGPLPLVAIEDWNGNRLQITRNSSGAITAITDASGREARLFYNTAGQCSKFTVPGEYEAVFSYSGGNLTEAIDLIGNTTHYAYDSRQRITSMETEGRTWTFSWIDDPDKSYLESIVDAEGKTTNYAVVVFDFEFFKTRVTDDDGKIVDYEFPAGRYQSDSRERMPTITYDDYGKIKSVFTKGDSSSTSSPFRSFEYDEQGRVTKIIENEVIEHVYSYNDKGLITSYLDALGGLWTNEYDDHGNLIRQESPAGRVTQSSYDAYGQLVRQTDPEGNHTLWTYDTHGNVASITDAEGSTTTFGYDSVGINLTDTTDPLGNVTTRSYDANRRLLIMTYPDGSVSERQYDGFAQTGYRNEEGDWRYVTRSPTLRVLSESDFLGNYKSSQYDAAGRMVQSTDPAGFTTHYAYNGLGQPEIVTDALGDRISWAYYSNTDAFASLTLSEDPLVSVYIDSDWYGISRVDDKQYVRDFMGRLKSVITPRDYWKRISFTRDEDGLIVAKNFNDQPLATFARDGNGQIVATTHTLGTDSFLRNKRGQVVRQTWFNGLTVQFAYDAKGNITSMTYPDGSVASYTYNSRSRIANIAWKGATLEMGYDKVGNIIQEHRSNGHETSKTSDANGLITGVRHADSARVLLDLSCTRNSRGLLSSCTKDGELPWLPVLSPENIVSEYTYNRSFTISKRQGENCATDLNGNQTSIPGERAFSGSYDFQNLLTEWTAEGETNTVVYDGKNRINRWTRNSQVRNFHYDEQDRLLFESDAEGAVTGMWLYRGSQVVAMSDRNGQYFYHDDMSGNISYLSDSSGKTVATYRYMPYGLQRGSLSSIRNPFTFVGTQGVLDLEDGLYYMRSRTYDAVSRAFLSNDPLGLGVDLNARAYAVHNPVNFIDPNGMTPFAYDQQEMLYDGADGIGSTTPPRAPTLREMRGLPPRSEGMNVDPCVIGTAWNTTGSINGKFGIASGVLQALDLLRQGEYGDAAYQAGSVAVGAISSVGGAISMFMAANPTNESAKELAEAKEWMKNNKTSKYGGNTSEPYQFTIPEFSLDD